MSQLEHQSTFNGEQYSHLSIPGKRYEGFNPLRKHYINSDQNKILVLNASNDILTSISSADGSPLKIENL